MASYIVADLISLEFYYLCYVWKAKSYILYRHRNYGILLFAVY